MGFALKSGEEMKCEHCGVKTCNSCGEVFSAKHFHARNNKCRKCATEFQREYQKAYRADPVNKAKAAAYREMYKKGYSE